MSNQYFFSVVKPVICQGTSASAIMSQMRSIIAQKQAVKWLLAKPILDSINAQIQAISVETEDPIQQAIIQGQVEILLQTQNNINDEITATDANFLTALQTLLYYK